MPRRDILLDDAGNRLLSGNDYAIADGLPAVGQGIATRVKLYRGEYWLDESLGVEWFGKVLVKNPNPLVIRAEIAAAIAAQPDVSTVRGVSYTFDARTRSAAVSYVAASTEGVASGTVTA
jgi:hypothetical protein